MCLDTLGNNKLGGILGMYGCHGMGSNQVWLTVYDNTYTSIEILERYTKCLNENIKVTIHD